jgi:hypothetical protein
VLLRLEQFCFLLLFFFLVIIFIAVVHADTNIRIGIKVVVVNIIVLLGWRHFHSLW